MLVSNGVLPAPSSLPPEKKTRTLIVGRIHATLFVFLGAYVVIYGTSLYILL